MDVHRAAAIPAGVHGGEPHEAGRVRDLEAAQEVLPLRAAVHRIADVRVDAPRVALPDVDHRPGERVACAGAHPRNVEGQLQRNALTRSTAAAQRADVAAVQLLVDEVRPLGERRTDDARGRSRNGRRGARANAGARAGGCRRAGSRPGRLGASRCAGRPAGRPGRTGDERGEACRSEQRERLAAMEHAPYGRVVVVHVGPLCHVALSDDQCPRRRSAKCEENATDRGRPCECHRCAPPPRPAYSGEPHRAPIPRRYA